MHCGPPAITFIPCEMHFRPVLPTIEGNVDYLTLRGQLITMDELLRTSCVENEFVTRSLQNCVKTLSQSGVEQIDFSGEGKCGKPSAGEHSLKRASRSLKMNISDAQFVRKALRTGPCKWRGAC